MFLSIVIPHYNINKELLERCITSITSQGMPDDDYEIIVVDDGSIQPPLWIEDKYSKETVKLVPTSHGGPGAARNHGIDKATGKYIMFVDADDYLIANGEIHHCLEILKREKPQILRYRYHVTTSADEALPKRKNAIKTSNTISGAAFMTNNNLPGSPCLYFFAKDFATRKMIRFPEGCFHEDEEFNTALHYHAQSLIDCDALLYCYCKRSGSTTASNDKAFESHRIDDLIKAIERITFFRNCFYEQGNKLQKRGIDRKLNMLAVDAILNMLYNGMSASEIRKRCIKDLAPLSLYPIPAANYSFKYRIFRVLANCSAGMNILRAVTPSKKPKRK